MKFHFTEHSIDRFIARVAPGMSRVTAAEELNRASMDAARLKEKSFGGQMLWRIRDPDAVLITKPEKGNNVVVTILSAQDANENDIPIEDLEDHMVQEANGIVERCLAIERRAQDQGDPVVLGKSESHRIIIAAARGIQADLLVVERQRLKLAQSQANVALNKENGRVQGLQAQIDRLKQNQKDREHELQKHHRALRAAMQYLLVQARSDLAAKEAVDAIRAIDPSLADEKQLLRRAS